MIIEKYLNELGFIRQADNQRLISGKLIIIIEMVMSVSGIGSVPVFLIAAMKSHIGAISCDNWLKAGETTYLGQIANTITYTSFSKAVIDRLTLP
jgi:hypothetical protein